MKQRLLAYAVSLALVGLVASPLAGAFANDSFPISTYPMFASIRPTEVHVQHVVLAGSDGDEWPAPPEAIANEAVLQAIQTIRQALRQGDDATAALCERVADHVTGGDAKTVLIVTSTYDSIRYYEGDQEPIARAVHWTCEVPS